ncbi:glycosyltransferase family 4 protein [Gimesia sp.]|uniref:MraY family glycosyltransferase n=1 Tax=Gimesia sp. TaxID=2024833 RepID=UPI000C54910B|nr:glycosyltransferase family 4 protein [Gimesia sp.]MAX39288.1 glycosyl transferase family 4 [Gimesia sp.]HBL45168.1 glycosyl transferase family 4 [Planctomycetaceae bacterium]
MMFSNLLIPGLIAVGLFLVSIICTCVILRLAPLLGLVKSPTSRCSHVMPTPRGGGVAFVVSSLIAFSMLYFSGSISGTVIPVILTGGTLIAALGFWDDLCNVPVRYRLSAQAAIIAASVYALTPLPALEFWGWKLDASLITWGIATVALIWWLNLFNFMDGIDGLAGGEAACLLIAASLLIFLKTAAFETTEQTLMVLLTVSLLGFMTFNWPPAKIFMGDAGSTYLGFTVGILAVSTLNSGLLNLWVWLILPAVFWVDATFTLLRRMIRRDCWYQAHQCHAYQRLSRFLEASQHGSRARHRAHRKVSVGTLCINVGWLFPLSVVACYWPAWGLLTVAAAWTPLVLLAVGCGAGKPGNIELRQQKHTKNVEFQEGIPLEI